MNTIMNTPTYGMPDTKDGILAIRIDITNKRDGIKVPSIAFPGSVGTAILFASSWATGRKPINAFDNNSRTHWEPNPSTKTSYVGNIFKGLSNIRTIEWRRSEGVTNPDDFMLSVSMDTTNGHDGTWHTFKPKRVSTEGVITTIETGLTYDITLEEEVVSYTEDQLRPLVQSVVRNGKVSTVTTLKERDNTLVRDNAIFIVEEDDTSYLYIHAVKKFIVLPDTLQALDSNLQEW